MTTIAQLVTNQAIAGADQLPISQTGTLGTNTNRVTLAALFAGAAAAGLISGGAGGTYVAGAGITITGGTIAETNPITTIGANLTLTNGTLTATGGGGSYTLPPATATALGGVIVGSDLAINAGGTLNLSSANETAIAQIGSNTSAITAFGTAFSTSTASVGAGGLTVGGATNLAALNAGSTNINVNGTFGSQGCLTISQSGTQTGSWAAGPVGALFLGAAGGNGIGLTPGGGTGYSRLSNTGNGGFLIYSVNNYPLILGTADGHFYGSFTVSGTLAPTNWFNFTTTSGTTSPTLTTNANGLTINSNSGTIGLYGSAGSAKPTFTGAKGGNAALATVISYLVALTGGTDSTTA